MRPITVAVGPLAAASATVIRTASAIAAGGAVTLNGSLVSGGIATIPSPRRITFTSSGNDSGITFAVVGTNWSGSAISETVTGTNGSVATSVLDYKTVSSITASAAAAGTVSIGTSAVAASPWVRFDDWQVGSTVAAQLTVVGTVNYTLQQTMDDPNSPTNPVLPAAVTWVSSSDADVVGATTTKQTNYAFAPVWARVLLNSGTGSVTATFLQGGSA